MLIRNNFLSHQNVVNIKLDGKITQWTEQNKKWEEKLVIFCQERTNQCRKTYYEDVKQWKWLRAFLLILLVKDIKEIVPQKIYNNKYFH